MADLPELKVSREGKNKRLSGEIIGNSTWNDSPVWQLHDMTPQLSQTVYIDSGLLSVEILAGYGFGQQRKRMK